MSLFELRKMIESLAPHFEDRFILGVQGGALSEGLDVHSKKLKGVFVVGPGLSGLSFERNLRAAYYQKKFGEGFNYAYIYPGMAKSIQAAGRVIRSEDKKGLVVLLDRRFPLPQYSAAMPADWFENHATELCEEGILDGIAGFWERHDKRERRSEGENEVYA